MSLFTRARSLYGEQGWPGVRRRVIRAVWSRQEYTVYRKDLCTVEQPLRIPGVQFRLASVQDLSWLCEQMSHLREHAEPILRQQFQGRDVTAIGVTEGNPPELVFSTWISYEDYALTILKGYLRKGDASIRRIWVPPCRRRAGLARQGLSFAEYAAKAAGIPQLWSLVDRENVASQNLHKSMGYEEFGNLRLIKQFRRRYVRVRTCLQPRWSVCMLPEGIVRL